MYIDRGHMDSSNTALIFNDQLLVLQFLNHLLHNIIQVLLRQADLLIRDLSTVELISKTLLESVSVQHVHHSHSISITEHFGSGLDVVVDGHLGNLPILRLGVGNPLRRGHHVVLADIERFEVDELVLVVGKRRGRR